MSKQARLKIHWRLSQGGEQVKASEPCLQRNRETMADDQRCAQPDLANQVAFAREAESLGFDSLLVDFGLNKPDAMLLTMAIALQTKTIKFIIACRSGLMSPTYFVQQLNTLTHFIPDRFSLNVVAGHSPKEQEAYGDFLNHDQRYARSDEYLAICHQLWEKSAEVVDYCGDYYQLSQSQVKTTFSAEKALRPECFIAGRSAPALQLAKKWGDTWVSLAQPPDVMAPDIKNMLAAGKGAGIRLSVICRETRQQAVAAAEQLITPFVANKGVHHLVNNAVSDIEKNFVRQSDSYGIQQAYLHAAAATSPWLNNCLWNGAVKSHGAPAIALVGTPEDVAMAIKEYQDLGVSQFIFSGWPQYDEMRIFGQQVLPLLTKNHWQDK